MSQSHASLDPDTGFTLEPAEPAPAITGAAEAAASPDAANVARTRRAVLGAALGAIAASVANAVGHPSRASAANGDALKLGMYSSIGVNEATSTTQAKTTSGGFLFYSSAQSGYALRGAMTRGDGDSYGVYGTSESDIGRGVYGWADVSGGTAVGVLGKSRASSGTGAAGWSIANRTGVMGYSSSSTAAMPATPANTGVFGFANQDATSQGVFGQSTSGTGVVGKATNGTGMSATVTTGTGIKGSSITGNGLVGFSNVGTAAFFSTDAPATGVALKTIGRVMLQNSAGVATIAAATRTVVVTPGIDLSPASAIVATLQGAAGGATVERVAVDSTANTFTIWLTKNTTATVPVAWHIFG